VLLASLGDLILDVVVQIEVRSWPATTGLRSRTSAQADSGERRRLGGRARRAARFIGKRGSDPAGQLAAGRLEAYGVELVGPAEGRSGVVVSIAAAGPLDGVRSRRRAGLRRRARPAWLRCDVLHVSGYSLLQEPIAGAAQAAAGGARAAGALVSVDLSSWTLIDERFRARVAELEPDLVFATDREREAFGELATDWIVKHGAAGVTVAGVEHPALAVRLVDPTGAGDAFAAGYLVGGVALGLEAAARCCERLGAMP
jgi:sugar/nucleoside kinase (ribokinase family)